MGKNITVDNDKNNLVKVHIGYESSISEIVFQIMDKVEEINENVEKLDSSFKDKSSEDEEKNPNAKDSVSSEESFDIKKELDKIKQLAKELTSTNDSEDSLEEKTKKCKLKKEIKIMICGKPLDKNDQELIHLLFDSLFTKEIIFEKRKEELGLLNIVETYSNDLDISETKFIKGSLRSGLRKEFLGSVVLLGDLNYGAEIVASGNVIVTGTLRGIAHAGANGNRLAFVSANATATTQIRIANEVKEITEHDKCPVFHIDNNEIVVDIKKRKEYGNTNN